MSLRSFIQPQQRASLKSILNEARHSKNLKTLSIELIPNTKIDVDKVVALNPTFVSVIWRFTKDMSIDVAEDIPEIKLCRMLVQKGLLVLLHLAGRYLTECQAFNILNEAKNLGIKDIFALKGEYVEDFEKKGAKYDFRESVDLIRFIKNKFENDFNICVAGYPDVHPRSLNWQEDIEHLNNKIKSGADYVITQAVFNSSSYHLFVSRCHAKGITVPILPGIWLFNSYSTLISCVNLCKVKVGEELLQQVMDIKEDSTAVNKFAVTTLTKLINDLLEADAPGVHLFSLNHLELIKEMFDKL